MADPAVPPWEERARRGPLTAFFQTVWLVLSHPVVFFEGLDPRGPRRDGVFFWVLATVPPLVLAGAQAHSFVERLPGLVKVDPAAIPFHIPWWAFVIVGPVLQFGTLFLGLLFIHGVLSLLKQAHGGFSGSLRAAGYSSAPAVLGVVPLIGGPVAGLWIALLQYSALRRVHRTGHGPMMLAYLIPAVAALIVGVLLTLAAIRWLAPVLEGLLPL